jgi:hypothetical protein
MDTEMMRDLHGAYVSPGDTIRAPDASWWRVLPGRKEASWYPFHEEDVLVSPQGVFLTSMGDDSRCEEQRLRGCAYPIPGVPGWERLSYRLVEATAAFQAAREELSRVMAAEQRDQDYRWLCLERGGDPWEGAE